MESTVDLMERIRVLAAPLSAEERLALIQMIAAMEPATEISHSSIEERRSQLANEQAAWYAYPPDKRRHYQGEFVAIYGRQVVDHDPDQRSLYLRVRAKFGHTPVLIIHADWTEPPVYTIHSPRLES